MWPGQPVPSVEWRLVLDATPFVQRQHKPQAWTDLSKNASLCEQYQHKLSTRAVSHEPNKLQSKSSADQAAQTQAKFCWHNSELLPLGEVAVNSATELCLGSVPVLGILEGDVGGCVVHHREGAHPEVVAQPGHQPELEEACDAGEVDEGRESYRHEGIDCCQANLDLHPSQVFTLGRTIGEGLHHTAQ